MAADILDGLEELHSRGVVVLDLKPDNVLMTPNGHAVLSDFGISRIVSTTIVVRKHPQPCIELLHLIMGDRVPIKILDAPPLPTPPVQCDYGIHSSLPGNPFFTNKLLSIPHMTILTPTEQCSRNLELHGSGAIWGECHVDPPSRRVGLCMHLHSNGHRRGTHGPAQPHADLQPSKFVFACVAHMIYMMKGCRTGVSYINHCPPYASPPNIRSLRLPPSHAPCPLPPPQIKEIKQAPEVPPTLPADLKAVLSRCLLFSPAQRPSLGELKASLANISFAGEQQVWQSLSMD